MSGPAITTREKVDRLRAKGGDRCTFHFDAATMDRLGRSQARHGETMLSRTVTRLIQQAVEAEEQGS